MFFWTLLLIAAIVAGYIMFTRQTRPDPHKVQELSQYTGFPTSAWGKEVWKILHITALNLPPNPSDADRAGFFAFVHSLGNVLPCGNCRHHFTAMLQSPDLGLKQSDLKDRNAAFAWTVRVHNSVNRRLGKAYPEDTKHWFDHYTILRAG